MQGSRERPLSVHTQEPRLTCRWFDEKVTKGATEGRRRLPGLEVPLGTYRKEELVGKAQVNPASKGKVVRLCAESSTRGSQCVFVTSPFSKAEVSLMVPALSQGVQSREAKP